MASKSRFKFGTNGDDTFNGTDDSEVFFGFGGNDTIFAAGGNDHAFGGRGDDLIFGGKGNDHLFGGRGNDALVGEDGNDHLLGGSGRDLLLGGPGKDVLVGGADNDTFLIRHGTGVDIIADLQAGDRIDIRDFNFASFPAVLNAAHQSQDDVVINLGGGDQLVIEDTKLSDLHPEQFIISSQIQGPTSTQTPYLVSVNSHLTVESLITTGDHALNNGYTMVGIPDGLGAFDNGNGTFTVLMNHEIATSNPAQAGVVRAHGANGAFVSEWVIDKTTLQVLSGHDLMHDVWLFDTATQTYVDHNAALHNGVSFSRFCSADLADPNAFYNPATGLGFNPADGRLFLDGEENNAESKAMAHIVGGAQDGYSYELAWLGNMAYENQLANPFTGDKTVVGLLNDTAAAGNTGGGSTFSGTDRGEVYFYVGTKQATGLAIDKAGLTGGGMYGVKVAGLDFETDLTTKAGVNGSHFDLVAVGNDTNTSADVHNLTGAQIENISHNQTGNGVAVTGFERPEDGAWDTIDHDKFYFVTTASINGHSKLWELDFTDAKNPALGGTVKMLLDGTEGQSMFDNITVSQDGKITLCEDPGNDPRVAKVWQYDPANGSLTELAHHDPERFDPNLNGINMPGPNFITKDEESSGVIDVSKILGNAGEHVFLIDTQSHKEVGGELVEGGQLMVMHQYLV